MLIRTRYHSSLRTPTLFSFALFDELLTGFLAIGLPLVSSQLHLNYAQVGLLFAVGSFSAMLFEPIINLLSDYSSRRIWIIGGLLLMSLSYLLAANGQNFVLLLIAFALLFPANGAAVGLAQAILVEQNLKQSEQTMTRWTIASSVGDLLAPLITPLLIVLNNGWSLLCWLAATLWLIVTAFIGRLPLPQTTPLERICEQRISPLQGLSSALRDTILLRWALLTLLPTMLDEVFIVYVTFYLHDKLHLSPTTIGILQAIHMCGAILGLILLERILLKRLAPQQLLCLLALVTLLGIACLLLLHPTWIVGLSLFIIGLGVTGWYPIAKAQAYKRMPGRSGTLRTILGLGEPFEIALPSLIGLVAQHLGITAGISLLGLAPLLIILIALTLKDTAL